MCAGCHLEAQKRFADAVKWGGNCVNMFALLKNGQFPFVTLITMRGEFGEMNPWQIPMGQGVQPVVEAMGMHCLRAETPLKSQKPCKPLSTWHINQTRQSRFY